VSEQLAPYRVDDVIDSSELKPFDERLGAGEELEDTVTVAGRLMRIRRQGKLVFCDLHDASGSIQLVLMATRTNEFDEFARERVIGDWVAVSGKIGKTKAGQLSIFVESWQLLGQAKHGFGDKWHGIQDPDIRFRRRYVDLWVNPEVRERFTKRSRIISAIRHELEAGGFMEVETPILQPVASGAEAKPFITHHNALDMELYLRIAPELYLKRLIVGGFTKVFEIGKDFRNEGISPRHNPEFTMLELYQAYADLYDMVAITETLIALAARVANGTTMVECQGRTIDLSPPFRRSTMEELVSQAIGVEVSMDMDRSELLELAKGKGVDIEEGDDSGKVVFRLYEELVEENLIEPTFVLDFPKAVSPLARDHRDPSRAGRVERFELVINGRELVNAFSELNDPVEQNLRFLEQQRNRERGDDEAMRIDQDYVRALEYGMPPTGGLGLGIDRLVMLLTGANHIKEVILFPLLRPEPVSDHEG
jgi:lysyl-tRNA synthetase class 2